MKKTTVIIAMLTIYSNLLSAQSYSAWIKDNAHPELKVRYATGNSRDGRKLLYLQIISTKACKLDVTTSLCSKDAKDKNKWQTVEIANRDTVGKTFTNLNTCTNGFWWWYKNYKVKSVIID